MYILENRLMEIIKEEVKSFNDEKQIIDKISSLNVYELEKVITSAVGVKHNRKLSSWYWILCNKIKKDGSVTLKIGGEFVECSKNVVDAIRGRMNDVFGSEKTKPQKTGDNGSKKTKPQRTGGNGARKNKSELPVNGRESNSNTNINKYRKEVLTKDDGGDDSSGKLSKALRLILSDTDHINSRKLGRNYKITRQYQRCCTSGPTTWYSRAGIDVRFWNNIRDGKKTAYFTKNPGWVCVASGGPSVLNSFKAKPGDIAIEFPNKRTKHACMWCGDDKGWRSDFKQRNCWVYSCGGYGEIWRNENIQ